MELLFLGSGGKLRIPRACCNCAICKEARTKGIPYERSGNAIFMPEIGALFETSEDINTELNRFGVKKVEHIFYSHWHPDHTAGIRILETISKDKETSPIVHLTDSLILSLPISSFYA